MSHTTFAYSNSEVSLPARRSVVDVFATIAWFNMLAVKAGTSRIADMSHYYSPQGDASIDTYKKHHRQWTERSTGRRRPSPASIAACEARCPRSAHVFDLALWPALRTDWDVDRCSVEVRQRLPSDLAKPFDIQLRDKPNRWKSPYVRFAKQRGTLDDLACLLIFLRRGNTTGSDDAACGLGRATNRVLLLQAGWLFAHGLLQPLVKYVDEKFWQRAPTPLGPWVTAAEYFHMLRWLTEAVAHHFPETDNGFDSGRWTQVAHAALSHADEL